MAEDNMIQHVVNFLNEALQQDAEAIDRVFLQIGVQASEEMINHPTIQVRMDGMLRLIGLLNGLVIENSTCVGDTCIQMIMNDDGDKIVRFSVGKVE